MTNEMGYETNTLDTKQARSIFSRVGLGLFLFMLLPVVLGNLVIVVASMAAPALLETGWFFWTASYVPMYLIAFPIMLLIYRTIPNTPEEGLPAVAKPMTVKGMIMLVIVSLGITYSLNILSTLAAGWFAALKGSEVVNPLGSMLEAGSIFANLLVVVIIAPIMEEIVFRGLLYNKLVRFGGKTFVVVSAVAFGLFHGNIFQIPYAIILGILMALVRLYTGKLRNSILLHLIINFIGSGIPTLLSLIPDPDGYEAALLVFSSIVMVVMVIGLIMGIVWLVRHRGEITFAPAYSPLPDKGVVFGNLGMILFVLTCVGVIILSLLS